MISGQRHRNKRIESEKTKVKRRIHEFILIRNCSKLKNAVNLPDRITNVWKEERKEETGRKREREKEREREMMYIVKLRRDKYV